MEIFFIGFCVFIDIVGFDDVGEFGEFRIGKLLDVLEKIDIVLLVVDC